MDLHAYLETKDHTALIPGMRMLIKCGFSMATERGWEAQIRPRSGLALKNGISIVNSPGTIDTATYRGEIGVLLINHGQENFVIKHGDRIAQMIIAQVPQVEIEEVEELDETERNSGGFGSTGV
jgi:dUTP pyrophosphatase